MVIHPARSMPIDTLLAGLETARAAGMVARQDNPAEGLALWCYQSRCVFNDGWNEFTTLTRGLILDAATGQIVATPFPKFFNYGERGEEFPAIPFETFEKLDGSLIILFHHRGRWLTATKGAFHSPQARWAQSRIDAADLTALKPGTTYLAEAIYPENRIVIRYPDPALVLLSAYDENGVELAFEELEAIAGRLGWRTARRHHFASLADLVASVADLPATAEGFVIRFENGKRLKMKGAEYRRIHALISRCTPIAMWEALAAGDDMQAIRRLLPEEFWGDFDAITRLLQEQKDAVAQRIEEAAASVAHKPDKELGLSLENLPADVRPFVFSYRKAGNQLEGKTLANVWKTVRPTANILPNYTPSYALIRVMDEAS